MAAPTKPTPTIAVTSPATRIRVRQATAPAPHPKPNSVFHLLSPHFVARGTSLARPSARAATLHAAATTSSPVPVLSSRLIRAPHAESQPAQRRPSSPFHLLRTIELQCVLHWFDLRSFLRFARCCRSTLHAASSEFAFRTLSPLRFNHLLHRLGEHLRGSRILSRAPILLEYKFSPTRGTSQVEIAYGEGQVRRVAQIRAMEYCKHFCNDLASSLFSHAALSGLTQMSVQQGFPSLAEMRAMGQHMRRLSTLHLMQPPPPKRDAEGDKLEPPQYDFSALSALAQLRALTDLRLTLPVDYAADADTQLIVDSIRACPSLLRLRLTQTDQTILSARLQFSAGSSCVIELME